MVQCEGKNTNIYSIFMQKTFSLWGEIRRSFLVAGGIFLLLFFSISTFAALDKDTPAANGGLTGGAFMYWMNEVMVSLPVDDDKYIVNKALVKPTAKKTRNLVDETNGIVATGEGGAVGIGTQSPSSLLEVSSDTPRVVVHNSEGNSSLSLVASGGEGKVFYDKNLKKIVFSTNGKDVFSVEEKVNSENPQETDVVGTIHGDAYEIVEDEERIVIHADQKCSVGTFVKGFQSDGTLICG